MANYPSLNREQIEKEFNKYEADLQRPFGATGWTWMGVDIQWIPRPKKLGGNIKRGNTYGVIKYNISISDGEITREDAIQELLKPWGLRRILHDVNHMLECAICGHVVIGDEVTIGGEDDREDWVSICFRLYSPLPDGEKERILEHIQKQSILTNTNESILISLYKHSYLKPQLSWLSICPKCVAAIARGKIRQK